MELTQMTREIIQQFRTLSAIPHPSGREAGLAHALAEIFQSMGGTVQTDALWNLRCDFPATAGLEQAPASASRAIWTWSAPRPRGATTTGSGRHRVPHRGRLAEK